ncbi:hypothetical protein C8F01DRAFT_1244350 [Mycena amicta]|nr:hypothetical protein C8F01DRAFT_1244350 [Mycena amicta]
MSSVSPSSSSPPSKKRKRIPSSSQATAYPSALDANGKLKPRRIDPDRLAVRLGSDLTADLDKFLVPGAKMPSFAASSFLAAFLVTLLPFDQIRQALVKKYNVDRRHIYDYLHSRGLRVAKEDKHLNLSRKAAAAASRKKAKVGKENIPPEPVDSAPLDAQAALRASVAPKPAKRRKITTLPVRYKSPTPPAQPAPSPYREISRSPSPNPDELACESGNLPDELMSLSEYLEHIPIPEEMPHDTITNDEPAEYFDFAFDSPLDLIEDPLFALDGLFDFEDTSINVVASPHPRFVSLHDICAFSQPDRMSFYDTVNASLSVDALACFKARPEPTSQPLPHYDSQPGPVPGPVAQPPVPTPVARMQPSSMKHKENINPSLRSAAISQPSTSRRAAPTASTSRRRSDPASYRYRENTNFVMATHPSVPQQPLVWTSPLTYPPDVGSSSSQAQQQQQHHFQARVLAQDGIPHYSPDAFRMPEF